MRITSTMMMTTYLHDLHRRMQDMERSESELTSGRAIQRPSDDPIGATRVLSLRTQLAQNAQYLRNVDAARSFLSATETNVNSIVDLVQRGHELAVQGANDTLSASDLQAIGAEADQLLQQAVQIANGKYGSYYLFGGTDQSTAPFSLGASGANVSVTPPTNPTAMMREIAVGEQIQVNIPGNTVLPAALNALAALRNAALNGTSADVKATIDQFQTALDSLMSGLADVGARLNRLDATQSRYGDLSVNLNGLLSQLQDADIANTITTLQLQQTSYQAALATGARVLVPSLLDFLH